MLSMTAIRTIKTTANGGSLLRRQTENCYTEREVAARAELNLRQGAAHSFLWDFLAAIHQVAALGAR